MNDIVSKNNILYYVIRNPDTYKYLHITEYQENYWSENINEYNILSFGNDINGLLMYKEMMLKDLKNVQLELVPIIIGDVEFTF